MPEVTALADEDPMITTDYRFRRLIVISGEGAG
jgi:hypothetical protein